MAIYICLDCGKEREGEFEEAPECPNCEIRMEKKVGEGKKEKEVEEDDGPPVEEYDDEDW